MHDDVVARLAFSGLDLESRLAWTCRGCGFAPICACGVCSACGAVKAPPRTAAPHPNAEPCLHVD